MHTQYVIRLVRFSNTEFGVQSYRSAETSRGSLKSAAKELMSLGVSFGEFDLAIHSMETNGHNTAEFGVAGDRGFMYSHNQELPGNQGAAYGPKDAPNAHRMGVAGVSTTAKSFGTA